MSTLHFYEPSMHAPDVARKIIKRARTAAKRAGEDFPSKPTYGGMYGWGFYICYARNSVRDRLVAAARKLGYDPGTGPLG